MVRVGTPVALKAKAVSGTDKPPGDVSRVGVVARRATPFPDRVMDGLPARRHVMALQASLFQLLKFWTGGKVRIVAPRALARGDGRMHEFLLHLAFFEIIVAPVACLFLALSR